MTPWSRRTRTQGREMISRRSEGRSRFPCYVWGPRCFWRLSARPYSPASWPPSSRTSADSTATHGRRPAYLVAATVAYPIVGRLSDIYGRRPFLIAGIVTFIAGSALVGLSESMNQVIGFRLVQGIGGGIIMTCSYVVDRGLVSVPKTGESSLASWGLCTRWRPWWDP